jgi:hypothetical protein
MSNFITIRAGRADGQADRQDKANSFPKFAGKKRKKKEKGTQSKIQMYDSFGCRTAG